MVSRKRSFVKKAISVLSVSMLLTQFAYAKEDEHPEKQKAAWDALHVIQEGNKRFTSNETMYKPDKDKRIELANGQHPHTILLSCSDSRVPPELIFDQGLGDIFSVRVAGNVLNTESIASIEYAIEHLGSRLVVIMGHESCGAVKAALTTPKGKSTGSHHIDQLISEIQSNLNGNLLYDGDNKTLQAPVRANVTAVSQELIKKSEIVREFIKKGELIIAQGIYSLSSGNVTFWYVGSPVVSEENEKPSGSHEKKSSNSKETKKSTTKSSSSEH